MLIRKCILAGPSKRPEGPRHPPLRAALESLISTDLRVTFGSSRAYAFYKLGPLFKEHIGFWNLHTGTPKSGNSNVFCIPDPEQDL